jgi:hypothetical protein
MFQINQKISELICHSIREAHNKFYLDWVIGKEDNLGKIQNW